MTKLDFSKPDQLQTRDGRQVRIYATDCGGAFPIHGAVPSQEGWALLSWTIDGHFNSTAESPYDLIRKPTRIKGWLNVYKGCVGSTVFSSKDKAIDAAGHAGDGRCRGQIYIDAEVQE